MCLGPEIAAAMAAASEMAAAAIPEAAASIGAYAGPHAAGMGMASAIDSALINGGMGGVASGLSGLAGGAKGAQSAMMGMQAMQMMQPHPPPMAPNMPAMRAQETQPLPLPYGPSGNSLGTSMPRGMPMSEETKRKLRAMGIQI